MKKSIAIIGSGPSALLLAAMLDEKKFNITIYERNAAPARKFLVAGDGGLNLTHSEELETFITRYTPSSFLEKSIRAFTNTDLRNWFKSIGIETYIGTSKRIFPIQGIKPIDVLNAILNELKNKNVQLKTNHIWKGWNSNNELLLIHNEEELFVKADVVVFALGGASWSKTGSDGSWKDFFEKKDIKTLPFQASNCAAEIKWNEPFLANAEGEWLKNISISCGEKEKKGEIVITKFGIEGSAVYALSPQIRKELNENKPAKILLDLKPIFTLEEIKNKLANKGNRSYTKLLQDGLNLSDVQIALLKTILTKEKFIDIDILAEKIKQLPLQITAMAPIDEAISTVGGVSLNEVNEHFQLKKLPHHYTIGEMLDWDAPTGGYLLQGCFSMGWYLAEKLNSVE
ncbi:MAG: TIGR03862 family flavoprotein [Bacteroidetes bacterium]|nr:TIGR03862 family flavoprotein [Bacteroidota bacterium]